MRSVLSTTKVLVVRVEIGHGWEAGEWTGGSQRSVINYLTRDWCHFSLKTKGTSKSLFLQSEIRNP